MDAASKVGNGLFVFELRNGRVTTLDNDARNYNRLTWNEEGTALAVLKGIDVEKMRERDNVLVAFRTCRPRSKPIRPWPPSRLIPPRPPASPRAGS